MIYDYQTLEQSRPYRSIFKPKREQYWKNTALTSNIVGGLITAIAGGFGGSGVGNIFGMVTKAGNNSIEEGHQADLNMQYQKFKQQLPENNTIDQPQTTTAKAGGDYSGITSSLAKELLKAAQSNQDNTDNTTVGNDYFRNMGINIDNYGPTGNETAPEYGGQTIETTPTEGTYDWNTNSNGGYSGNEAVGFKEGGPVLVHGGRKGEDDIALVNKHTGADTGIRVASGEMLVFNEELMEQLDEAMAKKDKKAVFNLVKETMAKRGEKKNDGGVGYSESGYADIKARLEKAKKDYEARKLMSAKNARLEEFANKTTQDRISKLITEIEAGGEEDYFDSPSEKSYMAFSEAQLQERIKELEGLIGVSGQSAAPSAATSGAGVGSGKKKSNWGELFREYAAANQDQTEPTITDGSGSSYKAASAEDILDGPIVQDKYDPNIRASLLQYMDDKESAQAAAELKAEKARKAKEMIPDAIGSVAGYGYDIFRLAEGMKGAGSELPKFSKSPQWVDYMDRMKAESTAGLSAVEMASLQNEADRTYAYDVANIYNLSGGNAGAALGNLGRAASSKYRNQLNIASLDRNAYLNNLSKYGSALGTDINLDRMIFNDDYSQAFMTKQAGAKLASDAITNMMERYTTDRYYGPGSQHYKLKDMQLDQAEENKDILASYKEYVKKNGFGGSYGPQLSMPDENEQTITINGKTYKLTE